MQLVNSLYIQNGLSHAPRTFTIRLSAPKTTRYEVFMWVNFPFNLVGWRSELHIIIPRRPDEGTPVLHNRFSSMSNNNLVFNKQQSSLLTCRAGTFNARSLQSTIKKQLLVRDFENYHLGVQIFLA